MRGLGSALVVLVELGWRLYVGASYKDVCKRFRTMEWVAKKIQLNSNIGFQQNPMRIYTRGTPLGFTLPSSNIRPVSGSKNGLRRI
jgi:hypothetical protein